MRTRPASKAVSALCAAAVALATFSAVPAPAPADLSTVKLLLVKKWSGLTKPLYFTAAKGDPGRAFVLEKGGRIRVIRNGRLLARPYLDISSKVSTTGEQGLLGLAFAPDFMKTGRFYINYTDKGGDTVIARYYTANRTSDRPTFSSRVVLKITQPYTNHNGGCLQFGPDGYLYIGMGDGGGRGDPDDRAQDPSTLLGKILRIDTGDSGTGSRPTTYRIPPSNPFVGVPGYRGEIWALGLRNPWRFSFDRTAGNLWIGDVGQGAWEEISFGYKGTGGQNYGWNVFEGKHTYPPGSPGPGDATPYTMPILEIGHPTFESVTGGYVYRGSRYPELRGLYIFGDYVTGKIRALRRLPDLRVRELADTNMLISSFGESATGELYVCDYRGGAIYRVGAR
jgi:glucose/arabinose dehydrogenase